MPGGSGQPHCLLLFFQCLEKQWEIGDIIVLSACSSCVLDTHISVFGRKDVITNVLKKYK